MTSPTVKEIETNLKKLTELLDKTNELMLPNKPMLRVDEVATYFDVSRSTIYLWIDHGLLIAEKYRGVIRVPRESVKNCRMLNKLEPLA
jgi:excisionase family DNA binding protein